MVAVAFISQKGGVGKSTLARALGAVLAHAGFAVRLADLDPRQQTLLEWHKLRDPMLRAVTVAPFASIPHALRQGVAGELVILDTPAGVQAIDLNQLGHVELIVQPTSGSIDDLRPGVLLFNELRALALPSTLLFALCRVHDPQEEMNARRYLADAGYACLPGYIPERSAYRAAHNRGVAISELTKRVRASTDALLDGLVLALEAHLARANDRGEIA